MIKRNAPTSLPCEICGVPSIRELHQYARIEWPLAQKLRSDFILRCSASFIYFSDHTEAQSDHYIPECRDPLYHSRVSFHLLRLKSCIHVDPKVYIECFIRPRSHSRSAIPVASIPKHFFSCSARIFVQSYLVYALPNEMVAPLETLNPGAPKGI